MGNEVTKWRNVVRERRKNKPNVHFFNDPLRNSDGGASSTPVQQGRARAKTLPPVPPKPLPAAPHKIQGKVEAFFFVGCVLKEKKKDCIKQITKASVNFQTDGAVSVTQ